MRIGLFIPCYIDQLYPDVGLATLEVLEKYGCEVEFPESQTCCGQPMANSGCWDDARPLAERFVEIFKPYEYVVCPSGSCTSMVVNHYHDLLGEDSEYEDLRARTFELCAFLTDILNVSVADLKFPYKVGMHKSCHGLRELRLGPSSETMVERPDKMRSLLEQLDEIELAELKRPDECCGFGGTFAVSEEAVSCMMGNDRIHDHEQAGVQVMTAGDMSCLMHMQGLIRRQKKEIAVMHVAEILAGREPDFSK